MKIIVAISGASGAIYGIRALEKLKAMGVETHLVISQWGRFTIECETDYTVEQVMSLASFNYNEDEMGAAVSSGSFKTNGMLIAPCSMKTLAGIANGYSEDLLIRAADVCIKECRKLVLLTRETPLSTIHLENMCKLAKIGICIMPPVPALYNRPVSLEAIIDNTVGRALEQFGLEVKELMRWNGL